jgi:hypothetical protein
MPTSRKGGKMLLSDVHRHKIKRLENIIDTDQSEYNRECARRGIEKELLILECIKEHEEKIFYGVWSNVSKKFCFGIKAESKTKASKILFAKIGTDAYKWRWDIRRITTSST